jgi:hypothetical protein
MHSRENYRLIVLISLQFSSTTSEIRAKLRLSVFYGYLGLGGVDPILYLLIFML